MSRPFLRKSLESTPKSSRDAIAAAARRSCRSRSFAGLEPVAIPVTESEHRRDDRPNAGLAYVDSADLRVGMGRGGVARLQRPWLETAGTPADLGTGARVTAALGGATSIRRPPN
jgi:hypothetical protein